MVSKDRSPPVPPRRAHRPRGLSGLRRPRLPSIVSLHRGYEDFKRRSLRGVRGLRASGPTPGDIAGLGEGGGGGGCLPSCCCCCCCCLNLKYIRTKPGMLRVAQLVVSWLCNWLVGRYALRVAATLGAAMPSFFLVTAGGALGCSVLLGVALLSAKSVSLLRASLFELAFHATAVGLYGSQASYLHVSTSIYLEPYKNDLETYTYAAVVTSYWLGYGLAVLHSLDTVYSIKHYGRFRFRC